MLPLILIPTVFVLLALVFVVVATPRYTSSTHIQIDRGDVRDQAELGAVLLSHIETIESDALTLSVIERSGLDSDDPPGRGKIVEVIAKLRSDLGLAEIQELSDEQQRTLMVEKVRGDLDVRRVEDTDIIRISYTAEDPEAAARIADEYALAFVDHQARQVAGLADQRMDFLRTRIQQMREQVETAYNQAQDIKSGTGQDIGDYQDLVDRISQLTRAISEINQAAIAVVDQVQQLDAADTPGNFEAAVLLVDGGARLLQPYTDAVQLLDRLKASNGSEVPAVELEKTIEDLRSELDRMLAHRRVGLEHELRVINARRDTLEQELGAALALASSEAWSRLRSIEYEAAIFERIYADYVRQLESELGSAQANAVSVMAPARADPNPSWPNYKLLILLAGFGGLGTAAVFVVYREWAQASNSPRAPLSANRARTVSTLRRRWDQLPGHHDDFETGS